jgi:hypothetical protein
MPRQSSAIVPAQNSTLTMICAYAAPMIPRPATVTRRYVAGTVRADPPNDSHMGVRVSPAARIAETPMIEIVWNTFNPPMNARYGAPADATASSAPMSPSSILAKIANSAPVRTPRTAPSTSDWRTTFDAASARRSPIRLLTSATVPIESALKTGNSRNVNWSDAPTAAVATAPR